jgi:hypothetical protein
LHASEGFRLKPHARQKLFGTAYADMFGTQKENFIHSRTSGFPLRSIFWIASLVNPNRFPTEAAVHAWLADRSVRFAVPM